MLSRSALTSWTLERIGGADGDSVPPVGTRWPAVVPGTVHTDLLAAGVIEPPELADNEPDSAWIGRSEWRYATTVSPTWAEGDSVTIEFAGIDTVAGILVDGRPVRSVENMHRRVAVDVTEVCRDGSFELAVEFVAQMTEAERRAALLGDFPNPYEVPYNTLRKMACNFGWDWGPTLVTAGLWRPVTVAVWRCARLAEVVPRVTIDGDDGVVELAIELERADTAALEVAVVVDGTEHRFPVPSTATRLDAVVRVPAVERWWPVDLGGQRRYPVSVTLLTETGAALDRWERSVGFRTVELDTSEDAEGSRFTLRVNGTEVFVRGANWIPDDCFPHRVTADRYAAGVADAVEANMNLLRVWGGGIYESDDFYDACDRTGVLVWQDFLFACAAYAEDDATAAEVAAEARDNVRRLAHHPSLVLWNGNNENIEGFWDWGWAERLGGRPWGRRYYEHDLPAIVAAEDGTRPYWPGSPFSGDWERHPSDPDHGTCHLWKVWNELDYTEYRRSVPRFAAEYGFQGPAQFATLRDGLGEHELRTDSGVLARHQKAADGEEKLARSIRARFPEPVSFDDWHFVTQVNQARALSLAIGHLRAHRARCSGSVIWQLNDIWPAVSWALVDSGGRRKPAWYAVRDAYRPRVLTLEPGNGLRAVLVNDAAEPWSTTLELVRQTFAGEVLGQFRIPVLCPAGSSVDVVVPLELVHGYVASELVAARADDLSAAWFDAPDRELALAPAELGVTWEENERGLGIEFTARTTVRDLMIAPDRLGFGIGSGTPYGTLLPGDTLAVEVLGARRADLDRLLAAPVLRSVNDLTAGPMTITRLGAPSAGTVRRG